MEVAHRRSAACGSARGCDEPAMHAGPNHAAEKGGREVKVIFFDIGDTLAAPKFDEEDRLVGFDVFPDALEALEDLRPRPFRLGLISNPGGESPDTVKLALEECGLLGFFDPAIIIFRKKDAPSVLSLPFFRPAPVVVSSHLAFRPVLPSGVRSR